MVPVVQVGARSRVHDDAERDEKPLVLAQRRYDAVVVCAQQHRFPAPGRRARRICGIRDGGGVAPNADTLGPGAPTEASPPSDPCPIGGCVRRDAIPAAPRSGVGVAKAQVRRGDRLERRVGLGRDRRRRSRKVVWYLYRCTGAPARPFQDARLEGGSWW